MAFLTQEEFALFQQYGDKYAYDYPEAHEQLKKLYYKLGSILESLRSYGFNTHIRCNPQNQGQKYATYHWAQLVPSYSPDSEGIIFFVIDFTANGFGIHIDSNQRKGYYVNDKAENYQAWDGIKVDKVCEMSKEEIVKFVIKYCNTHKTDYLRFGKEFKIKSCIKLLNMESYINLLESNFNLILTGAPGTGKTFLAKQIAAQMILEKEYDEKTAAKEEKEMMNEQCSFVQFHPSYDYTDFIEGLRPIDDGAGNVSFRREDGIFMKFCRKALETYNNAEDKEAVPKYVFIIDEINRGELSKIFGELFFSIDPGYRGEGGKVKTQYCNLWKDIKFGDSDAFYIPKNVYIIGTMNDIDRSVESMDFAFRRRFAFKEIKASENLGMLDDLEDKDNIIKRMENLNAAIEKVEGLSSAYHIGGSYFMKLKLYQNEDKSYDYDSLWNNHLEGLLMEYLRGMADAEKKVKELKEYYDLKQIASRDVDNE